MERPTIPAVKTKLSNDDRRRRRVLVCYETERSIKGVSRKLKMSPKTMGASFNVYIVAFAQLPAVYAQAAMA